MKLQEFIKRRLELDDNNPEAAVAILSEKEKELNIALNQIQTLKETYVEMSKKIFQKPILSCFEIYKNRLKDECQNTEFEVVDSFFNPQWNVINVGIKFCVDNKIFSALCECGITYENGEFCYDWNCFGISIKHTGQQPKYVDADIPPKIKLILEQLKENNPAWWGVINITFIYNNSVPLFYLILFFLQIMFSQYSLFSIPLPV
jgi:hypothetical protein